MRKFFSGKRKIVIGLFLVALIAIGLRLLGNSRGKTAETVEVKRGEVTEELILSGEVKAEKYAELYFQSSGQLSWVGVKEGDKVSKGQALLKLDTVKLSADLQRAYSDLRAAQATLDKIHDDVKGHSGDETFTQRESRTTAEVANDKAYDAVTKAQQDLKYATLSAPFAGNVSFVAHYSPGVNVSVAEKQVAVLDASTLYYEASADQTEILNLSLGNKVKIVLDSFSDRQIEGEVTYLGLSPKPDEVGSVYQVKIKFDSSADLDKVRLGMTGDARIILSKSENVLYLPANFISNDIKGPFVHKGNSKDKTYIETGKEGEENTEITKGVSEGDLIYD
jgi:membrane fusion protein (multidrug efflux system)